MADIFRCEKKQKEQNKSSIEKEKDDEKIFIKYTEVNGRKISTKTNNL